MRSSYFDDSNDDSDGDDDDDDDDYNDRYQEKSDGLPARLSPSLCARPGRSAAGVEEESCLQEGLDEDGDGGQQLDDDVNGGVIGSRTWSSWSSGLVRSSERRVARATRPA